LYKIFRKFCFTASTDALVSHQFLASKFGLNTNGVDTISRSWFAQADMFGSDDFTQENDFSSVSGPTSDKSTGLPCAAAFEIIFGKPS
jgi:hypothetical protein